MQSQFLKLGLSTMTWFHYFGVCNALWDNMDFSYMSRSVMPSSFVLKGILAYSRENCSSALSSLLAKTHNCIIGWLFYSKQININIFLCLGNEASKINQRPKNCCLCYCQSRATVYFSTLESSMYWKNLYDFSKIMGKREMICVIFIILYI